MAHTKVYTHNPNGPLSKNHKIVIQAYQSGLTGIKITWNHATSMNTRGWILESDQIKWLKLGFSVEGAIKSIKDYLNAYPLKPIDVIMDEERDQPSPL